MLFLLFLWGSLWFQLNNFSLETMTFFQKIQSESGKIPLLFHGLCGFIYWYWMKDSLHFISMRERVLFRTTLGGHTFVGYTSNVKYSKWIKTYYPKTTFCTVNTPPFIFMDPFILTEKKSIEAHTQFSVNVHVPVWKQDSESHFPALVSGDCYVGALLHL